MSILGDNIRKLRKGKGLTQNVLAEYLSVGGSNINHYEKATSTPSIENLIKLAGLFNVSIDDLLTNPDVQLDQNQLENSNNIGIKTSAQVSDLNKENNLERDSVISVLDSLYLRKDVVIALISRVTGRSQDQIEWEIMDIISKSKK